MLLWSHIGTGSGAGGGGGGSNTWAFRSSSTYAGAFAENNHTHSGVSIGPAAADRIVAVGLTWRAAANRVITGITVGGVALTQRVSNSEVRADAEIWSGVVNDTDVAGSTADIIVTADGLFSNSIIAVYSGNSASASAVATDQDTSATTNVASLSVAPSVTAGDFLIVIGMVTGSALEPIFSAGGLTTDVANGVHEISTNELIAGSVAVATTEALTVTMSDDGADETGAMRLAAASFAN